MPEEDFPNRNSDERLRDAAGRMTEERAKRGLVDLVGDLECILVHCERERLDPATADLLAQTGYGLHDAYESESERVCVLRRPQSADILVQSRRAQGNPFAEFNRFPQSAHLPNTRLETLVFACRDVARYAEIQKRRGTAFLTPGPVDTDRYRFIQTAPSVLTGNSIGMLEWRGSRRDYRHAGCRSLDVSPAKPARPYLDRIGTLDHIATRVRAADRDPAILEFMGLTEYDFDFAIHVPELNSITNVARLCGARFALVFTSGIELEDAEEAPGPTEAFVRNYGPRAHHMAFLTTDLVATHRALHADGVAFLSDLVGSEAEGIRQVFTRPAPDTLLVNEYIERYGDFDGFFVLHNVRELTRATAMQWVAPPRTAGSCNRPASPDVLRGE